MRTGSVLNLRYAVHTMLGTSQRLLRLLSLLQSRGFWSGPELAGALKVTERTVRRDVARLRELGYPVDASAGVAGGYRLGVGAHLPPLLLEDDEALAIVVGLKGAVSGGFAGLEESAARALVKLEQVLPAPVRRRSKRLERAVTPLLRPGPKVDPETLTSLVVACRDDLRARFVYAGVGRAPGPREVEPHGLVHAGHRWYLVAFDLGRDDWRTFRLDRIQGLVRCGPNFVPRRVPNGSPVAFMTRVRGIEEYSYSVQVVLHASAAQVRDRLYYDTGQLHELAPTRCRWEVGAHALEPIANQLATLGVDFDVLDPPELAVLIDTLAARLRRAARARIET
jgi:predicted DNA-binding transcriptional regulator YafY